MRYLFVALFLTTLCLVSGCGENASQPETSIPSVNTNVVTSSSTNSPEIMVTMTSAPMPEITLTLTPTLTRQEIIFLEYDALTEIPQETNLQGSIVLGKLMDGEYRIEDILLLDAQSREIIADLPPYSPQPSGGYSFATSPNKELLAYYSEAWVPKDMFIVDGNGNIKFDLSIANDKDEYLLESEVPGDVTWSGNIYWLNNEQIITEKWPWPMDGRDPRSISAILYNPFYGTIKEFPPIYPDITWQIDLIPDWLNGGLSAMAFDPTFTRVLYFSIDHDVILWDLEENEEIMRISRSINTGGPVWSEDGSVFMVGIEEYEKINKNIQMDLYLITRNGEMKRLTYLNNYLPEYRIGYPRWSPDKGKIAFLVTSDDTPCGEDVYQIYPAVINVDSSPFVNIFCQSVAPTTEIHWSPDSKQLLLSLYSDINKGSTVLLNLEDEYTTTILDNHIPLGWLVRR